MSVSSVRLPILATVKAAYGDLFRDFPSTLRALSLIFVLLIVFTEVPMLFVSNYAEHHILPQYEAVQKAQQVGKPAPPITVDPRPLLVGAFSVYMLQMVLLFCFTQGWYRQLLTGENKGRVVTLRLGRPEGRLMIVSIKAALPFAPFVFVAIALITEAYPSGVFGEAKPAFNIWPWMAMLFIGALYVQGRIALAYPISAMGEVTAQLRQSWNLTRRQGTRIAIGNVLVEAPLMAATVGLVYGLSWLLGAFLPETVQGGSLLDMAIRLLFKAVAEFCILMFIAGLSAYHARCYAYLVRSSSSHTLH